MCKFTCIKVLKKYEAYAEKLKAITDIIGEKQITKARESDVLFNKQFGQSHM
jgi:hypothetical protein